MSGMQTKELVRLIYRTLVDIWENEIQADYNVVSNSLSDIITVSFAVL